MKLKLYDEKHKEIETLVDEEKNPGTYEIEFDALESHCNVSLQSSLIFYRLEAGDYKCEKKMIIIK